jgi:hypothetical protein
VLIILKGKWREENYGSRTAWAKLVSKKETISKKV